MNKPLDIVVVTPTYNERRICRFSRRASGHPGFRMLVVDDASPDGTGEVAKNSRAGIRDGSKSCIGKALAGSDGHIDGLRHALKSGADLIFQMDADLSHNPEYLPRIAEAAAGQHRRRHRVEVLTGVSVVNWPLHRIFLSASRTATCAP